MFLVVLLLAAALLFSTALVCYKWGWIGLCFVLPLVLLMFYRSADASGTMVILLMVSCVGASAGLAFKYEKSFQFFIIVATLACSLVGTAHFYVLKYVRSVDLLSQSRVVMQQMIADTDRPQAEKDDLLKKMDESMPVIRAVIPFSYFINGLIVSSLCFFMLKLFFSAVIIKGPITVRGIEFFRMSDYVIFGLIAAIAVLLLVPEKRMAAVYYTGLNAVWIIGTLYLLQSFGIMKYFLLKKKLPVYILPLAILLATFFGAEVFFIAMVMCASWGALDFWADFRRFTKKNGEDPQS